MSYEFQSALFPTRAALCAAIAGEWLSAGGAVVVLSRTDLERCIREAFQGGYACGREVARKPAP